MRLIKMNDIEIKYMKILFITDENSKYFTCVFFS